MADQIDNTLNEFQLELGYQFNDIKLLLHALRHGSSTAQKGASNERLEFFGDAILDYIICEELFQRCAEYDEGMMTDIKGEIVSRKVIGRVMSGYNIRDIMILGKGMAANKKLPVSLYANMFEAVVAAVYLDSSIEQVRSVVLRMLKDEIDYAIKNTKKQNFKSLVQETVQKLRLGDLKYEITGAVGPEHERIFTVTLLLNNLEIGKGQGRNRKEAEQRAAEDSLNSEILSEQLKPE